MSGDNMAQLKSGDFSGLSSDYSKHRPDYSESILKALLGLHDLSANNISVADVGAGTGIWTRMIFDYGVKSIVAIEPNDDMRNQGLEDNKGRNIEWKKGSAEETGLPSESVDLVTMASSFHWADFDAATSEIHRILRHNGRFVAIWNPRLIEVNPMLVEIEEYLTTLKSDLKRVSSGRSGITETLTEKLYESPFFEDILYIETRHEIEMTRERYIGAWRSVNDLQAQLGEDNFSKFLDFVEKRTADSKTISATYLNRAWSSKKSSS